MRDFRISKCDTRNWVIEELIPGGLHPVTREPGPDKWEIIGYFGKLEDLAICLVNRQIVIPTGTLETQIPALLAELKAAEARITEKLTGMTSLNPNSAS